MRKRSPRIIGRCVSVALGIKFGEQSTKLFIRGRRVVWNLIFLSEATHSLARNMVEPLTTVAGTDAVYANLGAREIANSRDEMLTAALLTS